jgi:hypothetical protein
MHAGCACVLGTDHTCHDAAKATVTPNYVTSCWFLVGALCFLGFQCSRRVYCVLRWHAHQAIMASKNSTACSSAATVDAE